jgi:hypothetical protein
MKRFIFFAVAAIFCLGLAMPAMADVKIGGSINAQAYWAKHDKEREAGGVAAGGTTTRDDRTEFHLDSYRPNNYIWIRYTSKDKTYGGYYRLRMGNTNNPGRVAANMTTNPDLYYNEIWWKPNPDLKLTAGRQRMTAIGGLAPSLGNLGHNEAGTIVNIGWGNLHASDRMAFSIKQKINDWASLEFFIVDPHDDQSAPLTLTRPDGGVAEEEVKMPRFDLALPLKFGNIKTQPRVSYVERTFDAVAPNSEDSYEQWAAGLDLEINFGPLQFRGEYTFGENLGGTNYSGGRLRAYSYVDAAGVTRIADTEQDQWFVQLAYKFSKKTKMLAVYSQSNTENDVNPTALGDERLEERTAYGAALHYKLFPNLTIAPEITFWDYGDANKLGAATTTNQGSQTIYGVSFRLRY